MRATPPSLRMSAGTRSSAITATAPASSAIRASSAVVTSMITPPLSISARPLLTRMVASSDMAGILVPLPAMLPRFSIASTKRCKDAGSPGNEWNYRDDRGRRSAPPCPLNRRGGDRDPASRRAGARAGEPLLDRLRNRDPRHLVVEAQGELE